MKLDHIIGCITWSVLLAGWAVVLIFGLLSLKNNFLILLPSGLLQGDLRRCHLASQANWIVEAFSEMELLTPQLIDYASTVDIQAQRWTVKVTRLKKDAKKTVTEIINLSAFNNHKELVQSIERAFLQFKTREPTA